MRLFPILIALLILMPRVSGQTADSVHFEQEHKFRAAELILPTSLIASGALIHSIDPLHDYDIALRDDIVTSGRAKTKIDNYLQFLPAAALVSLPLVGLESEHPYRDMIPLAAESYFIGFVIVNSVKYLVDIQRPDITSFNSFPSGHTFTAFAGAELFRREYGSRHPWLAAVGYVAATTVGAMRVYNTRHWVADVIAGAGVGILSTSIAYWTYPWLNRKLTGKGCRLEASPISMTLRF